MRGQGQKQQRSQCNNQTTKQDKRIENCPGPSLTTAAKGLSSGQSGSALIAFCRIGASVALHRAPLLIARIWRWWLHPSAPIVASSTRYELLEWTSWSEVVWRSKPCAVCPARSKYCSLGWCYVGKLSAPPPTASALLQRKGEQGQVRLAPGAGAVLVTSTPLLGKSMPDPCRPNAHLRKVARGGVKHLTFHRRR